MIEEVHADAGSPPIHGARLAHATEAQLDVWPVVIEISQRRLAALSAHKRFAMGP